MSGTLSCSAANCVHNMSGLCSANLIHVAGVNANTSSGTECHTFAEKSFKNSFRNAANINIPGEIRQLFNRDSIGMSPKISCEALNCIYNTKRRCNADAVMIYGPGAQTSDLTQCETFKQQ